MNTTSPPAESADSSFLLGHGATRSAQNQRQGATGPASPSMTLEAWCPDQREYGSVSPEAWCITIYKYLPCSQVYLCLPDSCLHASENL